MKFFYLIITIFSFTFLRSQHLCMTSSNNNNLALYSEPGLLVPNYYEFNYCIKIYIHVIRKADGTGGQSVSAVNAMMGYLNMDFNPHGIYFNWDGNIDYINSASYYSPSVGIFLVNDNLDGVDIYLYGNDSGFLGGIGTGVSQADGIGEKANLYMSGYYSDMLSSYNPLIYSHMISHEMGHILNLYHTHHGTLIELNNPAQCAELVDGSNSTICGDYVNDTPADPSVQDEIDIPNCLWTGSGTDANGDPYSPDVLNLMSYSSLKCVDYFSIG